MSRQPVDRTVSYADQLTGPRGLGEKLKIESQKDADQLTGLAVDQLTGGSTWVLFFNQLTDAGGKHLGGGS